MASKQHSTVYVEAFTALRALAAAEGAGKATDAYGAAVADLLKEEFGRVRGLQRSRGKLCIQRLLGKQCRAGYPWGVRCQCHPPHDDHPTLWVRDGKPHCYVSQPYALGGRSIAEMIAFAEEQGLEMEVSGGPSWHYPGNVLTVIYTVPRNEAAE